MSCVGSIISNCSTNPDNEERTLTQRCVYMRDYLKLARFRANGTATLSHHIKISSKDLKECYILPDVSIDELFTRLAGLMHDLKEKHRNPPYTDFTCLSRLEHNKVFLDIDCIPCKNGQPTMGARHFRSTKLMNTIIDTVGRVFQEPVADGSVYVTNSGRTCGYHIFFNQFAYSDAVTEATLMDALEMALKETRSVGIDRGCTQMPLPTAMHSNSSRGPIPFVMQKKGTEWERVRLVWRNMDADTLKCLSSVAFPERHKKEIEQKKNKLNVTCIIGDALELSKGGRKRCLEDDIDADPIPTNSAKKTCLLSSECPEDSFKWAKPTTTTTTTTSNTEAMKRAKRISSPKSPPVQTGIRESKTHDNQEPESKVDEDLTGPTTTSNTARIIISDPKKSTPAQTTIVEQKETHENPEPESKVDEDAGSLISSYTDNAASFVCSWRGGESASEYNRSQRPVTKQQQQTETITSGLTNVIERLPYLCENDKDSVFEDKQYKTSLLCAEEAEAAKSSARLEQANRNNGGGVAERVYLVTGSSLNLQREYRLLVQLVNVNRAVYSGDLSTKREWVDIHVSYYDLHLHNPVLLQIFNFVFNIKTVRRLFKSMELEEVLRSISFLLSPFKRQRRTATTTGDETLEQLDINEEEVRKETRPHKSRLIEALIRVCSHLFGMVTAILSDLRNVQQARKRKDLTLLNCTVVNEKSGGKFGKTIVPVQASCRSGAAALDSDDDDDLDCSASLRGGGFTRPMTCDTSKQLSTNYTLLASLIVYEQNMLSDQALYAFLYYYHSFPSIEIDRIMDEVHHDGLMVTAVIKFFLMYDHSGRALTLKEIFEGFNDVAISLSGPETYINKTKKKKKNHKQQEENDTPKMPDGGRNGVVNKRNQQKRKKRPVADDEIGEEESGQCGTESDEMKKLMSGPDRRRRREMCHLNTRDGERPVEYEWKDNHLWQALIDYYLRPVTMHEERLVFANDGYDTFEDDAVESCAAHVVMSAKNTKSDVTTAFKDARTVWRMHHGNQLIYESDLNSDTMGCHFHINTALKMYEMFCGGCVTPMKRVHKNYLIDRTRFNMSVYDVVAECRTATVSLTAAIDRSYMNILLTQPVVPPVLEDMEIRHLFMSNDEIQKGSFCCLSIMDYIRALNLFERTNCSSKAELETCAYVEKFLDDLYTNQVAAERPPNSAADRKMQTLYLFYTLYIYEVVFNIRHTYAKREGAYISIERLCNELDVRDLLVLFFGGSSMKRVEGLSDETEQKILQTAKEWIDNQHLCKNNRRLVGTDSANGRFDVRPVLAAEIPDKLLRMKTLFGQFGFDVMQDSVEKTHVESEHGASLDPVTNDDGEGCAKYWEDESRFEQEFYVNTDWMRTACERIGDKSITGKTCASRPALDQKSGERLFLPETIRTIMRLELKRHINNDRLGKLIEALTATRKEPCDQLLAVMKHLPMRLKLLAFVLTTHTFKLKTTMLAPDFIESTYRNADGRFADERLLYEGDVNDGSARSDPPEKVWCRATERLLSERIYLFLHARWLAEQRFKKNFFVGLDPVQVYNVLYDYMKDNQHHYPAFKSYNDKLDTRSATQNLCTAMMFLLIMSAYDQEHVDLYLKVFLAVEWPGQWAKTIFVWKSNTNGGKSYLFDSIIKRVCANSTCINDPKGGKDNAPEKAEYVKNFVLFANEFSQANSNELKKIVSDSTFKFRMNYGNVMNEAYATGKIMFNCNTLPPTSDEAAINRLTLFSIPFWFCRRQRISDALLNWIRGLSESNCSRWEMAYRYELPALLTDEERRFLKNHSDTKNETDLFDGYAALRPNLVPTEFTKASSSLFLVQNKTSRLYVCSQPPTDRIVHGLINITTHFSWLRYFQRLDAPVDFSTLPASSQAVRSEWLSLTLPYQEWKTLTGARVDPCGRVPADTVNRSLQAFATKRNINYFGLRQFFETDFASSREAIRDEYYMWFDSKAVCD